MTKPSLGTALSPMSADPLDRYLSHPRSDTSQSTSDYVEKGSGLVEQPSLVKLRGLLTFVREKAAAVKESRRLATRVVLLADYFEEVTRARRTELTPALREVTFGLWYFLKGYDQIPDSVPEVGLLDDALVVEVVLRRNEAELRRHWTAQGRLWPEGA